MRLVLATANPGKVAEIAAILGAELGSSVEILPRPSGVAEVLESGTTLIENARLKAGAICAATGEAAVADDTGLEVDVLGGAPGIHSARFAGEGATDEQLVEKLLVELEKAGAAAPSRRGARFRTVALVRFPDGREVMAEGTVDGRIAEAPRGDEGFGYDPVFVPDEGDGRSFAQMTAAEKSAASHRGRAFRSLAAELSRAVP